jgi:hypothetical protein
MDLLSKIRERVSNAKVVSLMSPIPRQARGHGRSFSISFAKSEEVLMGWGLVPNGDFLYLL